MNNIEKLVDGYKRFRHSYFGADQVLFDRLTKQGQSPKTLVIGCCDSRVDPAIVTDCNPGDLFIIRNVANLVPPFDVNKGHRGTSSALEFGVKHLEVENIVVLGHSKCGGIRALLQREIGATSKEDPQGFIDGWMKVASHARNRVLSRMPDEPLENQARACEQEAILISLDNLLTFPWILERVAQRKLTLHGWYFDLERGELLHYNPDSNRFEAFSV